MERMSARGKATKGEHGERLWDQDDKVLEWLSSSRDWLQAKQASLRRRYISDQVRCGVVVSQRSAKQPLTLTIRSMDDSACRSCHTAAKIREPWCAACLP